jgi:hypothetical protein
MGTSDEFKRFISEKELGTRKNLSQEEISKLYDGYTEWARNKKK